MKKKPQRCLDEFQDILFSKLKVIEKQQQEILSLRLQLSSSIKVVENDYTLDYYTKRNKVLNMRIKMLELNIKSSNLEKESKAVLKDFELYEYSKKRSTYTVPEFRERYELTELLKMIEQHSIDLEIISYKKQICELQKELAYTEKDMGLITISERERRIAEQNEKIIRLDSSKKIVLEGTKERDYIITDGLNFEVKSYIERLLNLYIKENKITNKEVSQAKSTLLGKEELSEKDVHIALELMQTKKEPTLGRRK